MADENIDQSEDFLAFTLDGKTVEFDLFEAFATLADIDRAHLADLHNCYECDCEFTFPRESADAPICPNCRSANLAYNQTFLDDVAAYIRGKGYERCGRRAAGAFYQRVCDLRGALKKNTETPHA